GRGRGPDAHEPKPTRCRTPRRPDHLPGPERPALSGGRRQAAPDPRYVPPAERIDRGASRGGSVVDANPRESRFSAVSRIVAGTAALRAGALAARVLSFMCGLVGLSRLLSCEIEQGHGRHLLRSA